MDFPPVPDLLGYETWRDDDGYHAQYETPLPEVAQSAGCAQEIHESTPTKLTQAAVRNRVRVWCWQAEARVGREVPFTAGDPT